VALLIVSKNGDWIASAPVHKKSRWGRIPIPVRATSVWGHPLYSRLSVPLILGFDAEEAASALIKRLVSIAGSLFSDFQWLVEHGPVCQAIDHAVSTSRRFGVYRERSERALLLRRPESDYVEQAMNAKHRSQMRAKARKLTKQLGEPQVVDRTGDEKAVAQLIELEGQSRLAARGEVLAQHPAHARFFAEMCAAFATQDRLELLALEAGGQTLAITARLLAGRGFFGIKMAYDERYRQFSPGIQLELGAMGLFHERHRADWIDSCTHEQNETFNSLYPARRTMVRLAVIDPLVSGITTAPAMHGLRRLRRETHGQRARAPEHARPAP
jgi:hypothetical protein